MSIELLERGARALGSLIDQVAFVGGATVTLWITDSSQARAEAVVLPRLRAIAES
jgi:hypothetical protein